VSRSPRPCLTALAVLLLAAGQCAAAKPEASFALVDGWIEARVEQDGKPVAGARVEVFDVIGAPFAQGETAEQGIGTFPRPKGHTCRLAVTIGGKPCESVLLTFEGESVSPARVQLTFNDRSCCRTSGRGQPPFDDEPDFDPPGRVALLLAAGGCCLSGAFALALSLRRRPTSDRSFQTRQGPNRDDSTP
jgi:hypothetical protein